MRILATLILSAILATVSPALAADTDDNGNQNAKQTLEIKNTSTLDDNFLLASYVPKFSQEKNEFHPKNNFLINASAYTASADECGKSDGITASGAMVRPNHTLACPKQYAFGTRIRIDGMGTYTCEDRGGAIKGNHFDIYMTTKKEAFEFGRQHLLAVVVE
ncbi:MAG: 3D domain-containing protein [Candidatus Moranbacteria bacterium]|nr:3D domain-containing protein [Candidatus Moranbacteria bacterium]